MAKANAVWGIDVGQCALKALKLHRVGEEVAVEAFDIIEHEKILSQPDADRGQLIRNALEQFLARNNVGTTPVIVSMPGLTSFPCYVKLPPVETKKIPDIVRFEAQQQIPLPLEEVVWQYQTFQDPDSPDIEVGIFAVRRTEIASMLGQFAAVDLRVDAVQMAPLAMFNFMDFDGQRAEDGATLLIDVGADKTDLVIADKSRMWTRTIRIGGNNFTEALVRGFKLSFSKAEKLKRTAATSKYARQIFQAMRPVFADLVQEIQRSLGHYTSLHRETRLKKILALGNGFRLPGFQKYLEQNLNIPVVPLDGYNRLKTTGPVNTPVFTENIMSFAVAYGLGLQGLGLATVDTSLLPTEIARKRRWDAKRPWFAAAAACLILAAAAFPWRAMADRGTLQARTNGGSDFSEAESVVNGLQRLTVQKNGLVGKGKQEAELVGRLYSLYAYRDQIPAILNFIDRCFLKYATDQPQFGNTEAARLATIINLHKKPRAERKMVTLDSVEITFLSDIRQALPEATGDARRGWKITIHGRTPLRKERASTELVMAALRDSNQMALIPLEGNAPSPIRLVYWAPPTYREMAPPAAAPAAGAVAAGPRMPDPMMAWVNPPPTDGNAVYDPAEDMATDTTFDIVWVLEIARDKDGREIDGLPRLGTSQ